MAHWSSGPRYHACWQHRESKRQRSFYLPELAFAANLLRNPCAEIRSRVFLPLKCPSFTSIQNPAPPRLDPCQRNASLGSRCSCAMRAKDAQAKTFKGEGAGMQQLGREGRGARRIRWESAHSFSGQGVFLGLGQRGCQGVHAASSWLLCRERAPSQKGGVTAGWRHGSLGNPRSFRCGPLQEEGQVKGRPRWDGEREEEGNESLAPGFCEACDPASWPRSRGARVCGGRGGGRA